MDRKTFLKTTASAGLGFGLASTFPSLLHAGSDPVLPMIITVLHTNDTHARIDPFPSGTYAGMGGVTRRASLIREIRKENPNTLLFDAGDVFQGTPYFNYYKGRLDFDVMSQMRYDAGTLGNHEFDNKIEGFVESAQVARFPFVNSNYDVSRTALKDIVQPFIIKNIAGIKVGIFGLGVDLEGFVAPSSYTDLVYNDPVAIAREMVQELRGNQNCDLVFCLSHIGYKYDDYTVSDRVIATEVKGIDLIMGGHTHTFMDEPELFTDDEGNQTLVNQVGFAGIHLGRVDFVYDRNRVRINTTSRSLKIFG
jgi:5'-nucleotidase